MSARLMRSRSNVAAYASSSRDARNARGFPPFSAAAAAATWLGWGIGGSGGCPGGGVLLAAEVGGGPAGRGGAFVDGAFVVPATRPA